jgi:NitT/TauT family transport system substrate-binding protein
MRKLLKKSVALVCAIMCTMGYAASLTACKKDTIDKEVTVYMPDGAPALAMAGLMANDTEDDGISYYVTKADAIASKVTFKEEDKNADFCVMPLNAASKLLGDGSRYVMLGAVTNGNLYIVSKSETVYTKENLSALIGKKVGVLQINNVPGLTFKSVLNECGIAWAEMTNEGTVYEDKVNLLPIADATAVGTLDAECFVIAEPAATAQAKKGFNIVGDLQMLYGGEDGYPQAVLVGKKEIVEVHTVWMADFIADVKSSMEWLKTATGAQVVTAINAHLDGTLQESSLKAPLLTADVIGRCGVRYVEAKDCKATATALLQGFIEINPQSTALPQENFFWTENF